MKSPRRLLVLMALFCLPAAFAPADRAQATGRAMPADSPRILVGGPVGQAKAAVDTILLMGPTGSGAPFRGDFEGGWNGWTSIDLTAPTDHHWQVSDYNQAAPGNLAAWCGDAGLPSCEPGVDPDGGYGDDWLEILALRVTVHDPAVAALVQIGATLQHDSEPAYDQVHLSRGGLDGRSFSDLRTWDGAGTVTVAEATVFEPGELVDGTDILLAFRFQSDVAWSDADCSWPTAGACQIDDITVTVSQAGQPDIVSFTDFQDGTFGAWEPTLPVGVGDFARLRSGLRDLDPCLTNISNQVTFIDDGVVVPGTGGTPCIDWCYGPGGYIVNNSGGLRGPQDHLLNEVRSPVMPWPDDGLGGITLTFDVYEHELLPSGTAGMFWVWGIRSADTDGSAGGEPQVLAEQRFEDRNLRHFGGPNYERWLEDVADLVPAGRDEIQIRLGVYELGWTFSANWNGANGTPAPFFDNVAVRVHFQEGPAMSARDFDLFQDSFPEVDTLDPGDPGSLHVRSDAALNVAPAAHMRNDPGDSVVITVKTVRSGSSLVASPEMHYVIDANPLFDPYRTAATNGVVSGSPAVKGTWTPHPDKWAFDLPDTGLLFPGDVMHYFFRAGDDVGGDVRWAILPADTTGFGDFSDPLAYDTAFVMHALPSLRDDGLGGFAAPSVLFWNDAGQRGGEEEWYGALNQLGLAAGLDYDIYHTNGASSGVGNGLGGRTDGPALDHYGAIIHGSDDLAIWTLSFGDYVGDPGNDIGVLEAWLAGGDRGLLLTGDSLASDLASNGDPASDGFLANVVGVDVLDADIRPLIGNQAAPVVLAGAANPVFGTLSSWTAYGGCARLNRFDAVTPRTGALRLAEFADTAGFPGLYPYAAATLNLHAGNDAVVSLPYDLRFVASDPAAKNAAPLAARASLLGDVLAYFGAAPANPSPSPVPEFERLGVAIHPNPFNPATRVSYGIKAPGHLVLKVFNVRGELVRTLLDGHVDHGGHVMWNGTDDDGQAVASGVYFTEARMGGEVQVGKMALVK